MTSLPWPVGALVGASVGCIVVAVVNERRMQRCRQPGVSYADVTFRRDGGWRRRELFTDDGLRYQRRAATYGFGGAILSVTALVLWAGGTLGWW